jgi:hypothetical protein
MSYIGSWLLATEQVVVEISGWFAELVLGRPSPPLSRKEQAAAERVDEHAEELIDEFRSRRYQIAEDAREVFILLGQIPQVLHWDDGLKESLSALVLAAVNQSERFGDGTGAVKRQFATDTVIRVLEKYNFGRLPFLSIQKTLLAPFVGVLIDWSVGILNTRNTWHPVQRVKLPRLTTGAYSGLLNLALTFSTVIIWLKKVLFFPTKYERQLRDAVSRIEPEASALVRVLPPARLIETVERIVEIIVDLGQVTLPYIGLVERALTVAREFSDLNPAERTEAVFLMLRELLLDAYADDEFALVFLDSSIGDFLLRAAVEHATSVLVQSGLLPQPRRRLTVN